MDPFIIIIVTIVLVFGGLWGTLVLRALLQRYTAKLDQPQGDPRISELLEDGHLLEARLERVEEELAFLRELHAPAAPAQLPPSDGSDT